MSKEITGFKPGGMKWKKVMAFVYGWGGALVIVGAMFKIQHWPGASVVLIGGLGIEAVIFILSAFEPVHAELDWTLAYPELEVPDPDHAFEEETHDAIAEGSDSNDGSITEQLDNMLEEAKIEPELIASLGDGLRGLKDQTKQLGDMTDASVATNDYTDSLKAASQSVSKLSDTSSQASDSLSNLSNSNESASGIGEQFEKLTSNLSSLNDVYAAQLKSSEANSESSGNFYAGINELVSNLNDSVESTKSYKENIAELSKNLNSLNTVYGNMLNAMSVNRGE
jgi:gliding motility-associated protein GldL